jgi:hypothetical protein
MAQADQIVQNDTFPAFRADLNNNLAALFSDNSGTVAPTPTVAFMDWIDTSGVTPVWRKRNAANNAWVTVGEVTDSALNVASATSVVGTSTTNVPSAALATGSANSGTFLRGDRTWQAVPAGLVVSSTAEAQAGTNDTTAISPLKLREGLNASGSAPVYACRAWVNLNGIGTVAIRASGNVSSITDIITGEYQINFATAMPDANFSTVATVKAQDNSTIGSGANTTIAGAAVRTTSSVRVFGSNASSVRVDCEIVNAAIFR